MLPACLRPGAAALLPSATAAAGAVLLLPRPRLGCLPLPLADLVAVHHPSLRHRPRLAGPADGPPPPPLPPTRQCLHPTRPTAACPEARQPFRAAQLAAAAQPLCRPRQSSFA